MKAVHTLHTRATEAGIDAAIISHPKNGSRKHSSLGSTYSPSKVITLNGISMGIGQARQYIEARES
mgnify:FL=1|jgi:hypothetical protein